KPIQYPNVPDTFAQAKLSHQFYHQNIPALMRMFKLPQTPARAILATCPSCQTYQVPSLGSGVNPQSLGSCEVWQTDVT
ncbi:POL1 protein, partial [Pardalotus punctatus]|nr:POL1 protein [Pardalotus punctatus]